MKQHLMETYNKVRAVTVDLCTPLLVEDYVIQSSEDVSPPKWHLAHTSWFFETFILQKYIPRFAVFDPLFQYLFNSYYQSLGNPYPRTQRGLLSRPDVATVYEYRKHVDEHLLELIDHAADDVLTVLQPLIILGLQHEQQHQELLLTDIKHNLSLDPGRPVYQQARAAQQTKLLPIDYIRIDGGQTDIGHSGDEFCFDNELPRHAVILKPYMLANRLVSNGEYLEFIAAGGYQNPEWWLADGWECIQKNRWHAPLYWQQQGKEWCCFTLSGLSRLDSSEPVVHVSHYEADAYARWRGVRLPTEAEWEYYAAVNQFHAEGNFLENRIYHPLPAQSQQLFGDVWEWTSSPYCPYPGYQPLSGALGEYNGKFMSNQMVLRGGSCATPASHIRATYRNFFQSEKRWQFSGIRLAKNADQGA